jgi:glutamate 5-kinase
MESKLIAAEIATAAGVTTVITSSRLPQHIFGIIEYINSFKEPTPSVAGSSSPVPSFPSNMLGSPSSSYVRPPHTMFIPSLTPLRELNSWINHAIFPSGSVIINIAAYLALSSRESSCRLYPAGVIGVRGVFAAGQAVRIVIRRRLDDAPISEPATLSSTPIDTPLRPRSVAPPTDSMLENLRDEDFVEVGRGLANYNSAQIARVEGLDR